MIVTCIDGLYTVTSPNFKLTTRVGSFREAIDEALAYFFYGVYGNASTQVCSQ